MQTEILDSEQAALVTPQDYLEWAADRLQAGHVYCGHGTDNVWDEAAHLVLHCLGLPADTSHAMLPEKLSAAQQQQLLQLLTQRIEERVPLPYLTHKAWFMQREFYVDQRVLIPRSPFISHLNRAFSPWVQQPEQVQRVLDIGTGSGSLAICCALIFPHAVVDALDVSEEALQVAAINLQRYQLEQRVHLQPSDCFSALVPDAQYDVIISNPPYVGEDHLAELPAEYAHEPRLALYSDCSGLACVQQILQQAAAFLKPQGILFMEVGYNQQSLEQAYPGLGFTWMSCDDGGEGIFMLTKQQLADFF